MVLTGSLYREMAASAYSALEKQKEGVNRMNVFPVPDGDTGTNMALTLRAAVGVEEGLSLGECAAQVAQRMMYAARGNSGAILSLFFGGVAKLLRGKEIGDARLLALAFFEGAREAYDAVAKPKEGTVLTVMRATADAAVAYTEKESESDLSTLLRCMESAAETALEKTPEQLPVLKEACVVDAGGLGFLLCLKGMRAALEGDGGVIKPALPMESAASFADIRIEDIPYDYCTECIVEKNTEHMGALRAQKMREKLERLGDSLVWAEDERIVKVHLHTLDPGAVLSEAIIYGSLLSVKIENMKKQYASLIEDASKEENADEKPYGTVLLGVGEGIKALFLDLGADVFVDGGATMSPSVGELLSAAKRVASKNVFVLPNDKNALITAKQAAALEKEKSITVIPTETVAEGMAAMLALGDAVGGEDLAQKARLAYEGVTSMAVARAARDSSARRLRVKQGEYVGVIGGEIVCQGESGLSCAKKLVRGMAGASFVTVLYGEGVEKAEAEVLGALIKEEEPDCLVTVLFGGQPIYDYWISVE